jgi:hypothetical protein
MNKKSTSINGGGGTTAGGRAAKQHSSCPIFILPPPSPGAQMWVQWNSMRHGRLSLNQPHFTKPRKSRSGVHTGSASRRGHDAMPLRGY